MNTNKPSGFQTILFFGLGVLMVWLSWIQVKPVWSDLKNAFIRADYFWIFVSVFISFVSHYIRAYRWNYLLEPMGHKISVKNSLMYVLSAYLINYGIPRLGEISRCTLSYKYDRIPIEKAFGTVILERLTDTMIFIFFFIVALITDGKTYWELLNEYVISGINFTGQTPLKLIMLFILIGFIGSVVYYFRRKLKKILGEKISNILKGFASGISSIRKIKNPAGFIFWGIVIWLCYFYSLYFCMFAFKGTYTLGHKEALVLLLIGTFAVMFSPGGLGAYPLMLATILMNVYGVDKVSAFAMPWMAWGSQFLLILVSGFISLILLPVLNYQK
jgi:uncharacterized protein (TIRG00374 family)